IPPDDMRMIYQKANYFWHSDSSFKRVPSLCSILTARICPPEGGNTEFLCMRAAWDSLPPALQATIHPLVAEHSLQHSRDRVQKGILNDKTLKELPYELMWRADQPEFRLSHAWRKGDVIVWDNRAVVHRATYYDPVKYKRF